MRRPPKEGTQENHVHHPRTAGSLLRGACRDQDRKAGISLMISVGKCHSGVQRVFFGGLER